MENPSKETRGRPIPLLPPCTSRHVVAVLLTADGHVFVGSNGVLNPQPRCPRKAAGCERGQGWELCRKVCRQPGHAEIDVLTRAGAVARGSTIYLIGHDCACPGCLQAMIEAQVERLVVVEQAGENPQTLLKSWREKQTGNRIVHGDEQ